MLIENIKLCTGCSGCYSICPTNAIEMIEDYEGFLKPIINVDKCINCKKCISICPVLSKNTKVKNELKSYIYFNKNLSTRMKSSSGGFVGFLSEYILKNNGVIYGAAYDSNCNVNHKRCDNLSEIDAFYGSKYVESYIGKTYKLCFDDLMNKKMVLFCGTPCQIAGLKSFLKRDYENLITIDFICHGIPSRKLWKTYLQNLENKYGDIKNINFRDKNNGWRNYNFSIKSKSSLFSESHHKNTYMQTFLNDQMLRKSCYKCKFRGNNRFADITVADFWNIEKILNDDDKGVSLILFHNKKSRLYFERINCNSYYKHITINIAKYNPSFLINPIKLNLLRSKYFSYLSHGNFVEINKLNYFYKKSILIKFIKRIYSMVQVWSSVIK